MLCLDMKLVSRLRGLSSNSTSSTTSTTPSISIPPSFSASSYNLVVDKQRRKSRRGSGGNISPSCSDHESDEDSNMPSIRIVRNRSRSVCMPVLTSSQLRHLHRRASHHVYVSTLHFQIEFWTNSITRSKLIKGKH